jgi:hypothetical protein
VIASRSKDFFKKFILSFLHLFTREYIVLATFSLPTMHTLFSDFIEEKTNKIKRETAFLLV